MRIMTVILTGGRSSRMGRDKGSLSLDGETLLERTIRRWTGVFDGVAVSLGETGRALPVGVAGIRDLHPGSGPMAGLEAALAALDTDAVFLTAVDMPFSDPAMARWLAGQAGEADVCLIRRSGGRLEPLFALYRKSCLPVVARSIAGGRRAFTRGLFPYVAVREVGEEELAGFDVERSLFNANDPAEWDQARSMMEDLPELRRTEER